MFTHLFTPNEDAALIFDILGRKPLRPGQAGAVTEATFGRHFDLYSQTYIDSIDAILEVDNAGNRFALKFRRYLAHVPQPLIDLRVRIIGAEIVRFNSAPTKARAGYYENEKDGFTATVERSYPAPHDLPKVPVLSYVQNITVGGPNLAAVREFNTKLSTGAYNRFLVDAFE